MMTGSSRFNDLFRRGLMGINGQPGPNAGANVPSGINPNGNIPLDNPGGGGIPNPLGGGGSTNTSTGGTPNPLSGGRTNTSTGGTPNPLAWPTLYSMGHNTQPQLNQPQLYQPSPYTLYDQSTGAGRNTITQNAVRSYGTSGANPLSNNGPTTYGGNTFRGSFRRRTPGGYLGY